MSISEKLTAVTENMPRIFQAGSALAFRHMRNVTNLFNKATFPQGTELTVELQDAADNLMEMFRTASGIRKLRLCLPTDKAYRVSYMLYYCPDLEELELSEGARFRACDYFVARCPQLREIRGAMDLTESTNQENCFYNCGALEEVRFLPGTIRLSIGFPRAEKLSAESVASVLAGLAQVETPQVLQLHETVRQTLTQAQLQTLAEKNWTVE